MSEEIVMRLLGTGLEVRNLGCQEGFAILGPRQQWSKMGCSVVVRHEVVHQRKAGSRTREEVYVAQAVPDSE